jgi:ectoine hydroxylase-related dioxygenase (phytanoyl-CoA dioxygenase family)
LTLPRQLSRQITPDEIAAYERDGAAVVRDVVPREWIEVMREAIERILNDPGAASVEYTPQGNKGRYYGDFFVWMRDPDFKRFILESPMPELAVQVMRSKTAHFFYDQLLVKEPGTIEPTPWHQDLPYWPVRGQHILSLWVPFDVANLESGVVQYIKGSHKWGKMYAPETFGKDTGFAEIFAKGGLEPLPDFEAMRDDLDILHWDVGPGDVILHHPLTVHYAAGNASATGRRRGLALRYLGDDAEFDGRPGTFVENQKVMALLPGFDMKDGDHFSDPLFPQAWPR